KDDITKKTFAEYFNTILEIDERVLNTVKGFFERRNRELTEINRQQALVPKGCIVIENKNGTAPGMWMKKGNTVFISMPGVPYEMKSMMSELILPKIKSENKLPHIYHKTVLTQGLGESFLAEKIEKWEDALAENNIKLAYLPQPGIVRLRLSTFGENSEVLKSVIENEIEKLRKIIPEYIYGYENYGEDQPGLEKIVSELLRERKLRVSLAESCTGGYISHLITQVPGSSNYYKGGVVSYLVAV
ncbi:MAG TPA: CinA family protein, partial [Bacteroidia bacterium]|nr:CinA family protein [Bacteroidia bacterium]